MMQHDHISSFSCRKKKGASPRWARSFRADGRPDDAAPNTQLYCDARESPQLQCTRERYHGSSIPPVGNADRKKSTLRRPIVSKFCDKSTLASLTSDIRLPVRGPMLLVCVVGALEAASNYLRPSAGAARNTCPGGHYAGGGLVIGTHRMYRSANILSRGTIVNRTYGIHKNLYN